MFDGMLYIRYVSRYNCQLELNKNYDMKFLIQNGRHMFSAAMIGLAVISLFADDFIVGRPPAWPLAWGLHMWLGYAAGSALIIAAVAINFYRTGPLAALVVACMILALSVVRHVPAFMNDWVNAYKTLALLGGALVVMGSYDTTNGTSNLRISKTLSQPLVVFACILIAMFFITSGYAHFKFASFVVTLIPGYIPFRVFWTYSCGVFLIVGGIGLLVPATRGLSALLSGCMVFGWFLLLHIPRFLVDIKNRSEQMGVFESLAIASVLFVLAGKCRERNRIT